MSIERGVKPVPMSQGVRAAFLDPTPPRRCSYLTFRGSSQRASHRTRLTPADNGNPMRFFRIDFDLHPLFGLLGER